MPKNNEVRHPFQYDSRGANERISFCFEEKNDQFTLKKIEPFTSYESWKNHGALSSERMMAETRGSLLEAEWFLKHLSRKGRIQVSSATKDPEPLQAAAAQSSRSLMGVRSHSCSTLLREPGQVASLAKPAMWRW